MTIDGSSPPDGGSLRRRKREHGVVPPFPTDPAGTAMHFDWAVEDPADQRATPTGSGRAAPDRPQSSAYTGGRPPRRREPLRRGRAMIEGQARGVQQHTEGYGTGPEGRSVLTFRVEQYDAAGNRRVPVPVQLRAAGFDGFLSEGDEVRVTGRWRDGTLHTTWVDNLTTGGAIKHRSGSVAARAVRVIALVCVLGVVAVCGSFFIHQAVADNRQTHQQEQEYCDRARQAGAPPPPFC